MPVMPTADVQTLEQHRGIFKDPPISRQRPPALAPVVVAGRTVPVPVTSLEIPKRGKGQRAAIQQARMAIFVELCASGPVTGEEVMVAWGLLDRARQGASVLNTWAKQGKAHRAGRRANPMGMPFTTWLPGPDPAGPRTPVRRST